MMTEKKKSLVAQGSFLWKVKKGKKKKATDARLGARQEFFKAANESRICVD